MLLKSFLVIITLTTIINCNGRTIHNIKKRNVILPEPIPKEETKKLAGLEPLHNNADQSIQHINIKLPLNPVNNTVFKNETHVIENSPKTRTNETTKHETNETEKDSGFRKNYKTNQMESGVLMRGVLVFVALSLLFIIYLSIRTYCKRNKKIAIVRKYGVRTRRSDIEMTPLPLDEDEDDETVFDVGSLKT